VVVVDIVCSGKLEEVSGRLAPMPVSNLLHAPLSPQNPPATRDFSPLWHLGIAGYIAKIGALISELSMRA
jgi:hypothetical protein